jgi:hypothetical protein
MKKLLLLYLLAFVFSFILGFNSVDANAEDVEYRLLTYLVRIDFIPVPDADKHAIGIFERRGVAIFKNGETAAYHSRGTWDFIDGNGTFQGYTTLTFKDGSTTISKFSGNQTQVSGKLATMKGDGEYIKGTGKYEGIKGNGSFAGYYVTPYDKETKGDVIVEAKDSYTLPK